jgi:hypothetical protein
VSIAWSGLADSRYFHHIAKYCLPSWQKLPGDKYIVHDSNDINDPNINVIKWEHAYNKNAEFTKKCKKTKPVNFWRKMQSQIWALKNLKEYEWVVLLDTDVEILDFNQVEFNEILKSIKSTRHFWATGESHRKKLDAGHIVINMRDPRLNQFIYDYENIWESGEIFSLSRSYDGEAVESLFSLYPSVKIPNIDHGGGLHTYTLGTVHYGSKIPKLLRAYLHDTTNFMVDEIIKMKKDILDTRTSIEELEKLVYEKYSSK